jgi:hypothetical protein
MGWCTAAAVYCAKIATKASFGFTATVHLSLRTRVRHIARR